MSKKKDTKKKKVEDEEDEEEEGEVGEEEKVASGASKAGFLMFIVLFLIGFLLYSNFTGSTSEIEKTKPPTIEPNDIEYAPPVRKVGQPYGRDSYNSADAYRRAAGVKDQSGYVVEYGEGLPKTRNR